MYIRFVLLFGIIILLNLTTKTLAQKIPARDSTVLVQPGMDTARLKQEIDSIYIEGLEENKPMKATYYAAILPGLGQIYNKKYWKLPILYGGAATMGYFIDYNNKKYQQYRSALLEKKSFPEELWTNPLTVNISEDNLQRGVDYYRRNRDLLMILMAGVYFIQIVDAHVDAHLMEFDISEDLAFGLLPDWQPAGYADGVHYGFKICLYIN
jgi:hypothetical protein